MENHSYVLNESGRQLTIMTKAIIRRDYAFVTKPCLEVWPQSKVGYSDNVV